MADPCCKQRNQRQTAKPSQPRSRRRYERLFRISAMALAPRRRNRDSHALSRTRRHPKPEVPAGERVLAIDAETAALAPRSPRIRAAGFFFPRRTSVAAPGSRSAADATAVRRPDPRERRREQLRLEVLAAGDYGRAAVHLVKFPHSRVMNAGRREWRLPQSPGGLLRVFRRAWPPAPGPVQHQCTD